MYRVGSQTGASARCHEPSDPWLARISAPTPSCGTRARSAAIAAGEASVRSRIACQLIAGSESSSQSIVSTPRYYSFQPPPLHGETYTKPSSSEAYGRFNRPWRTQTRRK